MKLKAIGISLSLLAVLASLAACGGSCPPEARSGASPGCADAGPPGPVVAATCETACTNMRAHRCLLGEPTPKGATCEVVCKNVQAENAGAGFNVQCITRAETCAAAEACR